MKLSTEIDRFSANNRPPAVVHGRTVLLRLIILSPTCTDTSRTLSSILLLAIANGYSSLFRRKLQSSSYNTPTAVALENVRTTFCYLLEIDTSRVFSTRLLWYHLLQMVL